MTLDQIAQFVCSKTGQIDPNSVALCYGFINTRYHMIVDAFAWRDTEISVPVILPANTRIINLPAGMDRVIAARSNGDTFLDPINISGLFQTDPTIFERSGMPSVYEEITDPGDSIRKIRFLPTPTVDVPIFIVGKASVGDLVNPTDTPILRNIDNCLIAFAMGDMWERQRQIGKAQAKFTEAAAMLQSAQALEQSQSAKPRQSKILTVAGNSLAEMTDAVCARTGTWALENVILIKEFLRRNYQTVYDSFLWAESTVVVNCGTDGNQVILPDYVNRVIAVRGDVNLNQLWVADLSLYFGISPNIFEQTGSPTAFSYLAPVAVAVLPPLTEKLVFVTADPTEIAQFNVFVMGEASGLQASETVTVIGTAPVVTANAYDTPLTIAKPITPYDVTVYGQTSGGILQTLLASERERKHIRLWLQPNSTTLTNCLVLGKRAIKPLTTNEDTPLLRDIQSVLIDFATADMFMQISSRSATAEAASGQPGGYRSTSDPAYRSAQDFRQRAQDALKVMVDLEVNQGATSQVIVPSVEPDYSLYEDYQMNWVVAK